MEYRYTRRFLRSLKKLPKEVQDDVIQAVDAFRKNVHSPGLKLHRLHGKMKGYRVFSANFAYRGIVNVEKQHTYFTDVGGHNICE